MLDHRQQQQQQGINDSNLDRNFGSVFVPTNKKGIKVL